jgi:hypothetical protein
MAADLDSYRESEDKYKKGQQTKAELAQKWDSRIEAADRVYKAWANRFRVDVLYQYYEGFQWLVESDENNKPYVMNMVWSTIEGKLPNLLFDNPKFNLRPKPFGVEFDFEAAVGKVQAKEDALNFVVSRREFGLSDKHELALLDSFFGFGVIETDYNKDSSNNPGAGSDPLCNLYTKQIPFDQFRVSANANWDLSTGRWQGYYEYVPYEDMEKYIKKGLRIEKPNITRDETDFAGSQMMDGRIIIGEANEIPPNQHCKVWHIWDFAEYKYLKICLDHATGGDQILEYYGFDDCPLTTLRLGKRRKGWYPLPPVFNWICPQDEINDIRQTQKIHRKRFSRKYLMEADAIDPAEIEKLLYGPDGTIINVLKMDKIKALEDPPLDSSNAQSLVVSYDDFNRASGTPDEWRGQNTGTNRTTATQSTIINQRSNIRESKDLLRVGDFLIGIGRNILKALRKVDKPFWAEIGLNNEGFLGEVKKVTTKYTKIPPQLFKDEDYDIEMNMSSISPIYAQDDKKDFMEFLALITQYEILSFSPALLREAAYRCGYKNSTVLAQFQQLAQLAAIGKQVQLKNAVSAQMPAGPQGAQPGQMAEQQVNTSTPPANQDIMNTIFNRQPVQS